jgi:DNA polymerase-3 subunit epsilon
MTPLEGLPVLLLDAQATAGDPARGALLEIGWARWSADEARELPAAEVTARVVAAPPGSAVPPAVARITGLRTAEWTRGLAPPVVWQELRRAAERVASLPVPVVVHFARFEEPFLRALHERHGRGPFPFDLVCTHAIACRLHPELPRRTLRALAGYFGAAVPPLRRSADHVVATAFVWHELVALLAEREGVVDLADLREWLARPARRSPRSFPLPRERRLALPDRPGVYRLLRGGGAVLYVGKAASLRQRVSGHFHARAGERALEMLTQARDVSCTETATALEAALLETDEIKRLAPPFNVALASAGRAVWFATADLGGLQERPDAEHGIGPFVSPTPVEALSALRAALHAGEPASLPLRACAVGVEPAYAPGPTCFAAGLAQFVCDHGSVAGTRGLLRLGARLWARRRAVSARGMDDAVAETPAGDTPRRPAWDAGGWRGAGGDGLVPRTRAARTLARPARRVLPRGRSGGGRRRLLVFGAARWPSARTRPRALGAGPGRHARTPAERRAAFGVAAFDRLRVLTTELRRLPAEASTVELRLGPQARLSRRRLQAVLRWV